MRSDLKALWKPDASVLERAFAKYYARCTATEPALKEITVADPGINWKALIMSLPPPANSSVLGCGLRKVVLAETDCVYHGIYRFHAVRLDGTRAKFDFRDAYDDAYHSYKDKSFKHDVELALRATVLPQVIQYKEMLSKDSQLELTSHISGVALPWEKAVVQHFPITFHSLLDAFMNEMQLKVENVKLQFDEDHGYRLRDCELADRWRVFHRSHATYRIVSTAEAMEQEDL